MIKIYVASSLLNIERAKEVMNRVKNEGFQITYDWTTHGQVYNETECERIAILEEQGVLDCDVFLMVLPGRAGAHIEFGIARASNKHIIILQEIEVERKTFYYLPARQGRPKVIRVKTEDEAFIHIRNLQITQKV